MTRKKVVSGGMRDRIVDAAQNLFFENGYDGTTIRTIMKRAGGEVGLFYYYFKSKDDVFETALRRFMESYRHDLDALLEEDEREPYRAMTDLFELVERQATAFRKDHAENLHWTVRMALREYAQEMLVAPMKRIVENYEAYGLPKLDLDSDTLAVFLTRGVCGIFLTEDIEKDGHTDQQLRRAVGLLLGLDPEITGQVAHLATVDDVEDWLKLAAQVEDGFPGLAVQLGDGTYRLQLVDAIGRQEALVLRERGQLAGVLAFSRENATLDFLAVDPSYRRSHVATRLLQGCIAQFPVGTRICVTTYRDGGEQGMAARAFYRKNGFEGGEEVVAFGYPCEVLTRIVDH